MDFSRPDNARKINRLKVLSSLREKPKSRAELSKELNINKVSISEIADSLIKEGLIEESEKKATLGRPAIELRIREKSGRVVVAEVRKSNIGLSISDLKGNILRYERFPKDDEYISTIKSNIERLSQGAKLYGISTISKDSTKLSLGYDEISISPSIAEARAEMEKDKRDWNKTLFVSWSDSIEACFYDHYFFLSKTFPHVKVAISEKCSCGLNGCLEAVASGWALRERIKTNNLMQLAERTNDMIEPSRTLAYAIANAIQIFDAKRAVITGELSTVSDEIYEIMNSDLRSFLPEGEKERSIIKGSSGERGRREGAGIMALDSFFYHSDVLSHLKAIEDSNSL